MSRPMLDAAILAGGLATRLRPLTEKIPKSLVEVAGEPFLFHQLRLLRARGVRRAVIFAGYLGEMIREAAGDGRDFGVELEYVFDGDALLGTAGALVNGLDHFTAPFFVLYGDSYLPCDYRAVQDAFFASGKKALMTVFLNEGNWDTSNVVFRDGEIRVYDKKTRSREMRYIDYGLGVFTPSSFDSIPRGEYCDLADLYQDLLRQNELAGYEATRRYYEVGSFAGLDELDRLLSESGGTGLL